MSTLTTLYIAAIAVIDPIPRIFLSYLVSFFLLLFLKGLMNKGGGAW